VGRRRAGCGGRLNSVQASDEIVLSKHHGAGNDFLVCIDLSGERDFSPSEVRALCDRRRGIGADGLIRALASTRGAAISMDLRNADGSLAEMSGNGIRCLVQAVVDAGLVTDGTINVDTTAGMRSVEYTSTAPDLARAAVDMGALSIGPEVDLAIEGVEKARSAEIGNPHLVLLCPSVRDEMVGCEGARLQGSVPGGVNVEFVSFDAFAATPGGISVRVYERGVGETLACGTGACAAAGAARSWGLVEDVVRVSLPGGVLEVDMRGPTVVLRGPVRRIAEVHVRESDLAEIVDELAEVSSGGLGDSPATTAGRL